MTTVDLLQPETARATGRLAGCAALITGGDSPLGRAAAVAFAQDGADVALVHENGDREAEETAERVRAVGRRVLLLRGDGCEQAFCRQAVAAATEAFGPLDALVNVAGDLPLRDEDHAITAEQVFRTFRAGVFAHFYATLAALDHLRPGAAIVNVAVDAQVVDHAAAQGALVAFTRNLARALAARRIRVNGVAVGPPCPPSLPAGFPPDQIAGLFSARPAPGPEEIAGLLVFLASPEAGSLTGQILYPSAL